VRVTYIVIHSLLASGKPQDVAIGLLGLKGLATVVTLRSSIMKLFTD